MAVLPPRRHPALRAAADAAGLLSDSLEIVRAAYDALASGGPEAFVGYVHPEFEGVVPPELSAEPDSYLGHKGVLYYFESFEEDFEDLRFDVQELVEEEDGRVIGKVEISGRGRGSGIPMGMTVAIAMSLRDGKIATMNAYPDFDAARAAS